MSNIQHINAAYTSQQNSYKRLRLCCNGIISKATIYVVPSSFTKMKQRNKEAAAEVGSILTTKLFFFSKWNLHVH